MKKVLSKSENNKAALVFVHGLNGAESTWTNGKNRFIDFLQNEPIVENNYDIFTFNYPTQIIELTGFKNFMSMMPFKVSKSDSKRLFNVGLNRLGRVMRSDLSQKMAGYDTFIIIAHSMGGLISKKAIFNLCLSDRSTFDKLSLFVSLSVPHRGSNYGTIGSLILENEQIRDLAFTSEFLEELTQEWATISPPVKMLVQSGAMDKIVPAIAAVPNYVKPIDVIDTQDTHYSVTQKIDTGNSLYSRLLQELKTIIRIINQSPTSKSSGEVVIEFPLNTTFDFACKIIGLQSEVDVELIDFSTEDRNREIYGKVHAQNAFQALEQISTLNNHLPKYTIEVKGNKFYIKSQKP